MTQEFDELLEEVEAFADGNVSDAVDAWSEAFQKIWTNADGQWSSLTKVLPVPPDRQTCVENFEALVTSLPPDVLPLPVLVFLSNIASGQFDARYWVHQCSEEAVRFCAGVVNLWSLANASPSELVKPFLNKLREDIVGALRSYPATLLALSLHQPALVQFDDGVCRVHGGLEIPIASLRDRLLENKNSVSSLAGLLERKGKNDGELGEQPGDEGQNRILNLLSDGLKVDAAGATDLMRLAIDQKLTMPYQAMLSHFLDPVPDEQLSENSAFERLVMAALTSDELFPKDELLPVVEHCPFPSPWVSGHFVKLCRDFNGLDNRVQKRAFRLWAGYLTPKDVFTYAWHFLHAEQHTGGDGLFGKCVDERVDQLDAYFVHDRIEIGLLRSHHRRNRDQEEWQDEVRAAKGWVEFFRAIVSLLELRPSSYRGDIDLQEAGVRQAAADDALRPYPDAMRVAIHGILDLAEDHWSRLDPIVLGFPQSVAVAGLQDYAQTSRQVTHTKRYHAEALLRHAEGRTIGPSEPAIPPGSGLLAAVENLIQVSHSRMPRERSQTWLGDIGLETLWLGAADAACREFAPTFDTEGGGKMNTSLYSSSRNDSRIILEQRIRLSAIGWLSTARFLCPSISR